MNAPKSFSPTNEYDRRANYPCLESDGTIKLVVNERPSFATHTVEFFMELNVLFSVFDWHLLPSQNLFLYMCDQKKMYHDISLCDLAIFLYLHECKFSWWLAPRVLNIKIALKILCFDTRTTDSLWSKITSQTQVHNSFKKAKKLSFL